MTNPNRRRLGPHHITARDPNFQVQKFSIGPLRVPENQCPYCSAYQWPEECYNKGSKTMYWHCGDDGKIPRTTVTSEALSQEKLDAIPAGLRRRSWLKNNGSSRRAFTTSCMRSTQKGNVFGVVKSSRKLQSQSTISFLLLASLPTSTTSIAGNLFFAYKGNSNISLHECAMKNSQKYFFL